jgi:L-arabinose isomerase
MRPAIGPVTALCLTVGVNGRLKLIAAEGETLPGSVPAIGNSLSRVRFGLGVREFLDAWCALAPTHHVALGRGHRLAEFRKVATLLGLALETVA